MLISERVNVALNGICGSERLAFFICFSFHLFNYTLLFYLLINGTTQTSASGERCTVYPEITNVMLQHLPFDAEAPASTARLYRQVLKPAHFYAYFLSLLYSNRKQLKRALCVYFVLLCSI